VLHRLRQQTRNKGVQTLTPQTLHGAQLRAGAQACQLLQGLWRVDKPGLLQLGTGSCIVLNFFPQRQPLTADDQLALVDDLFFIRICNNLAEMPVDAATPRHQLLMECRPAVKAHNKGDTRLILFGVGQHLGLAVGNGLNRVFGVAQKFIAFAQLADYRARQIALPFQGGQHFKQRPLLQTEITAAVDQLECLGNKLHFTNSARPQFDVVGHAFAPHFLLDQLLHGAQRFNRRKIQVTAIHKRAQQAEQLRAHHLITGHDPGLDHCIALPVAALILVVLLQRIKAQHQRPGRAIRAQAHVDAKHKTVDGHRVQRLDQALTQADKKLLVVQSPFGAHRFPAFGVGENQVDVRRQVQLYRAELAHAQNHHLLGLATAVPGGRAELLAMALIQPAIGLINAGIGHVRQVAAGFNQIGLTVDITPDNPDLLTGTLATQRTAQLIIGGSSLGDGGNLPAQLAGDKATVQFP